MNILTAPDPCIKTCGWSFPPLNEEDYTDPSQPLPGSVCSVLFSKPEIFLFSSQRLVTNQPFVSLSKPLHIYFKAISP